MTKHNNSARNWEISHVSETGSTQQDLVTAATAGAPDRTVLVADVQRAGRGRLGRAWQAPAGTALMFSVLLRPDPVPAARRGWAGALLGLAATTAIEQRTGLHVEVKWPNDLLLHGRKTAGILAELADDALVVGMGLNVSLTEADLPRPRTASYLGASSAGASSAGASYSVAPLAATSLMLAGASAAGTDRSLLLRAILECYATLLDRWISAEGDMDRSGLRADYLARSATVGQPVRLELPDGETVTGTAVDVTTDGAIVIDTGTEQRALTAGDVVHLRPAAGTGPEPGLTV